MHICFNAFDYPSPLGGSGVGNQVWLLARALVNAGHKVSVVALASMPLSLAQCAAFLLCIRFWDATVVLLGLVLAARTGIGLFRKPSPALRVIAYPVPTMSAAGAPSRQPPDAPAYPVAPSTSRHHLLASASLQH